MLRNPSSILKTKKSWSGRKYKAFFCFFHFFISLLTQKRYASVNSTQAFQELDTFPRRHIGPNDTEIKEMLSLFGAQTLDEFSDRIIPHSIKRTDGMHLPTIGADGKGETAALRYLKEVASLNNTKVIS